MEVQEESIIIKIHYKINQVFLISTTLELSVNKRDLQAPTLAGPLRAGTPRCTTPRQLTLYHYFCLQVRLQSIGAGKTGRDSKAETTFPQTSQPTTNQGTTSSLNPPLIKVLQEVFFPHDFSFHVRDEETMCLR